MTTGSVRGKCSAPQAGQARFQPWSATRGGGAAAGAEGVGRVPAEDALGGGGGAGVGGGELGHHRAQVAEGEALRQRRVDVAAVVEEGAGAGGGALPVGDAAGEARGAVGGAEEDRARRRPRRRPGRSSAARRGGAAARARSAACPARARGRARAGRRRGSPRARRWAARSSAPRAKVTASASRMVSPRFVAARPCRKAAAAAIGGNRLEAGAGAALSRRPRGWRGQALRQPGQVRKEAAVTVPAWVVVQPLTPLMRFPAEGFVVKGLRRNLRCTLYAQRMHNAYAKQKSQD